MIHEDASPFFWLILALPQRSSESRVQLYNDLTIDRRAYKTAGAGKEQLGSAPAGERLPGLYERKEVGGGRDRQKLVWDLLRLFMAFIGRIFSAKGELQSIVSG